MARIQGMVKKFDAGKGYGFATQPGKPDVFVHRTELQGGLLELNAGDVIEYEVAQDEKDPSKERATKVTRIKAASAVTKQQKAAGDSSGYKGPSFTDIIGAVGLFEGILTRVAENAERRALATKTVKIPSDLLVQLTALRATLDGYKVELDKVRQEFRDRDRDAAKDAKQLVSDMSDRVKHLIDHYDQLLPEQITQLRTWCDEQWTRMEALWTSREAIWTERNAVRDDRDDWRMIAREQVMVNGSLIREHGLDLREERFNLRRSGGFTLVNNAIGRISAGGVARVLVGVALLIAIVSLFGCGNAREDIMRAVDKNQSNDSLQIRLDHQTDSAMVENDMNPRFAPQAISSVASTAAPIAVRPTEPITAYRVVVCDEQFQAGKVAPVCPGKSADRLGGEFDSDEGIWVKTRFIIPAERLVPGPVEIKRIITIRRDDGVVRTDTLSSLLEYQDGDNQFRVETPYPGVYTVIPVDPGMGQEISDGSVQFRIAPPKTMT